MFSVILQREGKHRCQLMEHVYVSKHKVAAAAADYDAVCHTNDVFG